MALRSSGTDAQFLRNMQPAVLIVDDMEVNRDILSFYFRKEYTVLEAADGEEAIDTIKKYTDRIALVFLDFYMPGKSGLDVLSFMQTDNYNIPVIMVTGEPDNELEKQAFALGAADIIYKPFDPDVVYGFASKYIQ